MQVNTAVFIIILFVIYYHKTVTPQRKWYGLDGLLLLWWLINIDISQFAFVSLSVCLEYHVQYCLCCICFLIELHNIVCDVDIDITTCVMPGFRPLFDIIEYVYLQNCKTADGHNCSWNWILQLCKLASIYAILLASLLHSEAFFHVFLGNWSAIYL